MSEQTVNREDIQSLDLETAMARLDGVVGKLSGENVKLEDALALYEEGVALVRQCNTKLDSAQRKISILRMTPDGEVAEEPFDAE